MQRRGFHRFICTWFLLIAFGMSAVIGAADRVHQHSGVPVPGSIHLAAHDDPGTGAASALACEHCAHAAGSHIQAPGPKNWHAGAISWDAPAGSHRGASWLSPPPNPPPIV